MNRGRLTPNERDALEHLRVARVIAYHLDGWLTPMFCGGTNGSHHSATLARLCKKGLAERRLRGGAVRGSYLYRITSRGRSALGKGRA